MNARPRTVRATAAAVAAALLFLVGGCSHYHIGIPLVPGLSLGLGATKDGNFSVGLNTGWGPLGRDSEYSGIHSPRILPCSRREPDGSRSNRKGS